MVATHAVQMEDVQAAVATLVLVTGSHVATVIATAAGVPVER